MDATFDGVFFITICTLGCAGVTVLLKMMYKSKCSEFTCGWGCMRVVRNTDAEIELHEKEDDDRARLDALNKNA